MPELQPDDPRRLGGYELTSRLGEGGQGVVYLGIDPAGTKVAVKLLHPDLTENAAARSRFVREVQSAKRVKQFCTAQVLEADLAGDRPYIVSEYIPGPSLQRLVIDEGPRRGAALDRLAIGTITALVAIHQAEIVHRDFKPHNVLIGPDGPRVIDFGIARALDVTSTVHTQAIGTPAYMAPEQVTGASLTNAVDVFSWAAVMVFAATGTPPFGQDTVAAVINRILNQEPDLTGVPDDLRGLIADCLVKEPGRRPKAPEILMRLLGQEGIIPPPAPADPAANTAPTMRMPTTAAEPQLGEDLLGQAAHAAAARTDPRNAATDPRNHAMAGHPGGPTTPGLQPTAGWTYPMGGAGYGQPQRQGWLGSKSVAVGAAAAALVLAAIVAVTAWVLVTGDPNTGHPAGNAGSVSVSVTDTGAAAADTSAARQPSGSAAASAASAPVTHSPTHHQSWTPAPTPSETATPTVSATPTAPSASPTGSWKSGLTPAPAST